MVWPSSFQVEWCLCRPKNKVDSVKYY
jgi:hypothetical protein